MKETGFPSATPWARSQGNVSNNRKLLYKAGSALNCLQSGRKEHRRVLRRDTSRALHTSVLSRKAECCNLRFPHQRLTAFNLWLFSPEQRGAFSPAQNRKLNVHIRAAMSFFCHGRKKIERIVLNLQKSRARLSTSLIWKGRKRHSHVLKHDVASAHAEGRLTAPLPALPGHAIHGAQQFETWTVLSYWF